MEVMLNVDSACFAMSCLVGIFIWQYQLADAVHADAALLTCLKDDLAAVNKQINHSLAINRVRAKLKHLCDVLLETQDSPRTEAGTSTAESAVTMPEQSGSAPRAPSAIQSNGPDATAAEQQVPAWFDDVHDIQVRGVASGGM